MVEGVTCLDVKSPLKNRCTKNPVSVMITDSVVPCVAPHAQPDELSSSRRVTPIPVH